MRAGHQAGLLSLFEEYQGHPRQVMAIAWLELNLPKDEFQQFKDLWLGHATIAIVPVSSSSNRVDSPEDYRSY